MDRMIYIPITHFKNGLPDIRLARWKAMFQIAPDHAANDSVFSNTIFPAVQCFDRSTIANDRNRISYLIHLAQFMRDQNRGNPMRLELKQELEKFFAVALI